MSKYCTCNKRIDAIIEGEDDLEYLDQDGNLKCPYCHKLLLRGAI